MTRACDCCTGYGAAVQSVGGHRPGLASLRYRIGTHATFFDAMVARLSAASHPELAALKTRDRSDFAIALLDAWAIVGDVLTFYQERIANEGYLPTATERRSILELARLIGYVPRPGVAATVYLAFTLEKDSAPVTIEPGARCGSVPGPGEQMESFETSDPLYARVEWNLLAPRLTQPQTRASILAQGLYLEGTSTNLKANDPLVLDFADGEGPSLFRIRTVEIEDDKKRTHVILRGTDALDKRRAVAALLKHFRQLDRFDVSPTTAMATRVLGLMDELAAHLDGDAKTLQAHLDAMVPKLAQEVHDAHAGNFTRLEPWVAGLHDAVDDARKLPFGAASALGPTSNAGGFEAITASLKLPPSIPPPHSSALTRSVATSFGTSADTVARVLTSLQPSLDKALYTAWKNLPPPAAIELEAYAMRVTAAPFGHNAPLRLTDLSNNLPVFGEWNIDDPWNTPGSAQDGPVPLVSGESPDVVHHTPRRLFLDADYDIAPDSLIVIQKQGGGASVIRQAEAITKRSIAAYSLTGKTVQIDLSEADSWIAPPPDEPYRTVRTTRVYGGSEQLKLALVPIPDDISGAEIELDKLYEDLEPGRWMTLSGERTDISGPDGNPIPGIRAGELVMLARVEQRVKTIANAPLAGDQIHTFITLASGLNYRYKRETVTIYGNVVKATQGETVPEVLGSGDASKPFQQFTLKRPPLTYVSAATPSGIASTLEIRVNDVLWHEAPGLATLTATDHAYLTRTDDDAKTTSIFGDGTRGARLPTGIENVKATYRTGIGKGGNVKARQISLLTTRPLGVKEVINPLAASGGADRETRDEARRNAPLAVAALDRLVSTIDYADFARTFAGIGKAIAKRLSDGRRQIVHVTVAGAGDIPILPTSDLFRNLYAALHRYGDPFLPIAVAVRERLALVISAKVRVAPDYAWPFVEPNVRAALLATFGFDHVELGADLLQSTAIRAIQAVPGVAFADVDTFDVISEAQVISGFTQAAASLLGLKDRIAVKAAVAKAGVVTPAQLAYLTADVPATLILQELKP